MISPTAHDEFEKGDFRVDDGKEVEGDEEDQKNYDDRQRKKKKNKRVFDEQDYYIDYRLADIQDHTNSV